MPASETSEILLDFLKRDNDFAVRERNLFRSSGRSRFGAVVRNNNRTGKSVKRDGILGKFIAPCGFEKYVEVFH